MSFFLEQKIAFLVTHKHFRLAIGISKKCSIVCGGLELKKNILDDKLNMLGFAAYG